MDVNLKAKDLDAELDKHASVYSSGGGYGSPEGELDHQIKFQLLMHRQNLRINKLYIILTGVNIILTLANVIYPIFFRI